MGHARKCPDEWWSMTKKETRLIAAKHWAWIHSRWNPHHCSNFLIHVLLRSDLSQETPPICCASSWWRLNDMSSWRLEMTLHIRQQTCDLMVDGRGEYVHCWMMRLLRPSGLPNWRTIPISCISWLLVFSLSIFVTHFKDILIGEAVILSETSRYAHSYTRTTPHHPW